MAVKKLAGLFVMTALATGLFAAPADAAVAVAHHGSTAVRATPGPSRGVTVHHGGTVHHGKTTVHTNSHMTTVRVR